MRGPRVIARGLASRCSGGSLASCSVMRTVPAHDADESASRPVRAPRIVNRRPFITCPFRAMVNRAMDSLAAALTGSPRIFSAEVVEQRGSDLPAFQPVNCPFIRSPGSARLAPLQYSPNRAGADGRFTPGPHRDNRADRDAAHSRFFQVCRLSWTLAFSSDAADARLSDMATQSKRASTAAGGTIVM
jgi:hypothetical protein